MYVCKIYLTSVKNVIITESSIFTIYNFWLLYIVLTCKEKFIRIQTNGWFLFKYVKIREIEDKKRYRN